jgi:dihydroxyacetone kinase
VNPRLALDSQNKGELSWWASYTAGLHVTIVIYIASPDQSKVALLCGGGSGHEPAHAGFVGKI